MRYSNEQIWAAISKVTAIAAKGDSPATAPAKAFVAEAMNCLEGGFRHHLVLEDWGTHPALVSRNGGAPILPPLVEEIKPAVDTAPAGWKSTTNIKYEVVGLGHLRAVG